MSNIHTNTEMTTKFWKNVIQVHLNKTPTRKNKRAKTSYCWKYFKEIGVASNRKKCKCKTCGKEYSCSGKLGTSHLHCHICKSLTIPRFDDIGNMIVNYTTNMRFRKLDHNVVCKLTAQMIILHDLSFQCVKLSGFKTLCQCLSFNEKKSISRNTITTNMMTIYLLEKENLKNQLARSGGRVCLTFDCWTACTTHSYITLTTYFIDNNWKLNSKLLTFSEPPHTGHELSRKVLEFLK